MRERERERERVNFQLKQGGGVIFHTNNSTPCVKKKTKNCVLHFVGLVDFNVSKSPNPPIDSNP